MIWVNLWKNFSFGILWSTQFPIQSEDTTTCFALGLHLVFMFYSFWCCWLMWFDGNSHSKWQALLVRKVNACNPLRRNPPIIVGQEREVLSLGSWRDYCLLLDVQQKCVQEHRYFFSAWFSFDVSLDKIIRVFIISKLNFYFIVCALKHTETDRNKNS